MEQSVMPGKPGVVILVAILNFITAAMSLFVSFLIGFALLLGNLLGWGEAATRQAAEVAPQFNWAGPLLNLLLGGFALTGFVIGLSYIGLGLGLLGGRRSSWYCQIVLSIFGLIFVPIGTILNAFILIYFFQKETRDFFGV